MKNAEMENPLKAVSKIFIAAGIWYILQLVYISASGLISDEITVSQKMAVTGVCLSVLFLVCYLRKSILALWAAAFSYPIMFLCKTLISHEPPDINDAHIFTVICVVLIFYFGSKYKIYNEYLRANGQLAVAGGSREHNRNLRDENSSYDSRNPLEVLFYAAIITALFAIYNISTRTQDLANAQEIPTVYSSHTTTLLIVSIFIACYLKRSIFAWWIMLVAHPVIWPIHYVSRSFPTSLVIPMLCGYLVIIWYLAVKYRAYRDYIA